MRKTRQWMYHPRLAKKNFLELNPSTSQESAFKPSIHEVMLEALEFHSVLAIVYCRHEQYYMLTGRIVDQKKNRLFVLSDENRIHDIDIKHVVAVNIQKLRA
ncbi:hypothetical protein G4V62_07420 [Bacillaceae bacterium SIJ1]|uniref:hypothetical protein n=1 Tax=Litoribacterium kuwaitense TaxID=1398745 RepID=UPI0013E9FBA2|nr:hypothetical protein [Litoribacterium kuwaitense]NGP44794.1 hypothetical protein [Litoribacterium kuwaitense]